MSDEMVIVPVTVGFDHSKVIGELRIRKDALPPTPGFVFNIAYSAHDFAGTPGTVPRASYAGPYTLQAVSVATDEQYAAYLRQVGVIP
jgi:hypothetical protein